MKKVQVFRGGKSLFPYECELAAYEKDGWSTSKESKQKAKSLDKPQLKSTINKEA